MRAMANAPLPTGNRAGDGSAATAWLWPSRGTELVGSVMGSSVADGGVATRGCRVRQASIPVITTDAVATETANLAASVGMGPDRL
jgi:hypothetical protein